MAHGDDDGRLAQVSHGEPPSQAELSKQLSGASWTGHGRPGERSKVSSRLQLVHERQHIFKGPVERPQSRPRALRGSGPGDRVRT